jgi:uncharacterized protein (DUF169 family)
VDSKIAKTIFLKYHPVALIWTDKKPEAAMQFQEKKWGCVMWLIANAAKGKSSACDIKTFGCFGAGVGLGFGNQYKNFPGGEDGFCHFLSSGNASREGGMAVAEQIKPFMTRDAYDNFLYGERYFKTPKQAEKFIECLPMMEIPTNYIVFEPLQDVNLLIEKPQTVIFFVNPDQLSALVVLANYGRGSNENVIIPYAAGCQTIGIYPYREATSENPRAVVGLTDISARVFIRKQLGENLMSFAVPLSLYEEMEQNVAGSFLERHSWNDLVGDLAAYKNKER